MASQKVTLPGSERQPVGTRVAAQSPDEVIEVSIILQPKSPLPAPHTGEAIVSRKDFAAKYGADPAAVEKIKEFAAENHLTVTDVSAPRRTVKLEGKASDMTAAFGASLEVCEHEGHRYRSRTGGIQVPADLAPSIQAVLGLDNRPQARAQFRIRPLASAGAISYTPPQVAALYQFPSGITGTGETVGIIELGGGYTASDLSKYFSTLSMKTPSVTAVLVDNAKNKTTTSDSADGEVQLDIEVVGSVAPGAKIVVYFAPNTDQGFQDALTTAIHDSTHNPSVISISWGGPESTWTAQSMTAMDSAAQDAAALGVSICVASGDSGSSDGVTDGANHVDFPASSPNVLACGGTSLQSTSGKITSETVWNDGTQGGAGGGGYSNQFPLPAWQSSAGIKPPSGGGRGVPDVSADSDPETGYNVVIDGTAMVIGGTSAAAPLWAALIALLNQSLGKPVGFLQPAIYGLPKSAGAFHDIVSGSNGSFSAGPGWDAASGLGSPIGQGLLTALTK